MSTQNGPRIPEPAVRPAGAAPAAPLPTSADVLIVGAGPAGLALAAGLAARGVDAVVVDRLAERGTTSRAIVVHARTMEVLDGLGAGAELVGRGLIVPRFTIRDRDRILLAIDLGGLPTAHPYMLMVPQYVTEAVLLDRLTALGGRVHRPCELTGLEQDAGGVTATMASGETIRARYVVGADGMHSAVREHAGIGFTGSAYPLSFVLADVRMEWALGREEAAVFLAPAGPAIVAPLPGGRTRVVAAVTGPAPERLRLDDVRAILDARGPMRSRARVTEVEWSSRFRVHRRLADRFRDGRIFLAGDAAHVHSPLGGQGMNTSIQDAADLAGRLTAALRPGAGPDGYEAARRPVAEGVVAFTDRLTRAATLDGSSQRWVRNLLLRGAGQIPAVRRAAAMNLSELAADGVRRAGAGAPRS
ncbi:MULTISPECIES: FAD-dependent monooxygenase [Thermomonosporaceae]|uniref:FAD-dependent monooxygenase n=1 Tax=Thermomonosporaceae TaxID=2012 RepID=UPI00255ADA51|nr:MULTISPECIES: FAD-dependent monooxygenase [Thermomonosporaceae]MDL4770969.1 FAD-dependent monooxygenase [Actinomadura xylanilytica]